MSRARHTSQGRNYANPTKVVMPPNEARVRADHRKVFPYDRPVECFTGTVTCGRCHAIFNGDKRWHLDETEFRALSEDPAIESVVCPACEAIEHEEYDGQVTLTSPLIAKDPEVFVGLIRNTEARLRENNPMARIAQLTVKDDTITVLTITPFLAERIGKELKKAYHGKVELQHLQRERFIRVSWYRE